MPLKDAYYRRTKYLAVRLARFHALGANPMRVGTELAANVI